MRISKPDWSSQLLYMLLQQTIKRLPPVVAAGKLVITVL
jgi:hypothetical protein